MEAFLVLGNMLATVIQAIGVFLAVRLPEQELYGVLYVYRCRFNPSVAGYRLWS